MTADAGKDVEKEEYSSIAGGAASWCEYKRRLGVEFGEYSRRQYEYAKEYYQIMQQEFEKGV